MKKNRTTDQEEKRKLRRLRLNRETIRLLSEEALLGLAKGGSDTAQSNPCCATDSCVNQNCVPTACSGCSGLPTRTTRTSTEPV